jgi:transposase
LAQRHLAPSGAVLYDLSSSYFDGDICPLARSGYGRDGKKGKLQVNYVLLTDPRGCPVALSVYEGNAADPTTLIPTVHCLREEFELCELILIGDRGMISQKAIAKSSVSIPTKGRDGG